MDGTTCIGGQSCDVEWLDNGDAPLLTTIGPCFVGLFNGQGVSRVFPGAVPLTLIVRVQQLIQQIEPVDVASVHSLTFTVRVFWLFGALEAV